MAIKCKHPGLKVCPKHLSKNFFVPTGVSLTTGSTRNLATTEVPQAYASAAIGALVFCWGRLGAFTTTVAHLWLSSWGKRKSSPFVYEILPLSFFLSLTSPTPRLPRLLCPRCFSPTFPTGWDMVLALQMDYLLPQAHEEGALQSSIEEGGLEGQGQAAGKQRNQGPNQPLRLQGPHPLCRAVSSRGFWPKCLW